MEITQNIYNYSEDIITLANGAKIFPMSFVLAGCYLGADVKVESFSMVESGAVIGSGCTIRPHNNIACKVSLGMNVFVADKVCFIDHLRPTVTASMDGSHPWMKTYIGNRVSIGVGAIIFPVSIHDSAIIGAGAIVLKDVPPGVVVRGVWK